MRSVPFKVRAGIVQHEEHVVQRIEGIDGNDDFRPGRFGASGFDLILPGKLLGDRIGPVAGIHRQQVLPCAGIVPDVDHHGRDPVCVQRAVRLERHRRMRGRVEHFESKDVSVNAVQRIPHQAGICEIAGSGRGEKAFRAGVVQKRIPFRCRHGRRIGCQLVGRKFRLLAFGKAFIDALRAEHPPDFLIGVHFAFHLTDQVTDGGGAVLIGLRLNEQIFEFFGVGHIGLRLFERAVIQILNLVDGLNVGHGGHRIGKRFDRRHYRLGIASVKDLSGQLVEFVVIPDQRLGSVRERVIGVEHLLNRVRILLRRLVRSRERVDEVDDLLRAFGGFYADDAGKLPAARQGFLDEEVAAVRVDVVHGHDDLRPFSGFQRRGRGFSRPALTGGVDQRLVLVHGVVDIEDHLIVLSGVFKSAVIHFDNHARAVAEDIDLDGAAVRFVRHVVHGRRPVPTGARSGDHREQPAARVE